MTTKSIYKIGKTLATLALLPALYGCKDDLKLDGYEYIEEGLPATLNLTVSVPSMTSYTRGTGAGSTEPGTETASQVNDLWIGVFSSTTGEKTGEKVVSFNDPTSTEQGEDLHIDLEGIKLKVLTSSGYSYVVAVANAESNNGTIDGQNKKNLLELLREVDTWEEYSNIAAALDIPTNVKRDDVLLMSGSLQDNEVSPNYDFAPQTVGIQAGENNKAEKVHLRRLDAYNLFTVKAAKNVTIEPVSWQVCNMPALTWVKERNTGADDEFVNASDVYLNVGDFGSGYNGNIAYQNTDKFERSTFDAMSKEDFASATGKNLEEGSYDEASGIWAFDFYQRENRRTGIIDIPEDMSNEDAYNFREQEFKNGDVNTGWYKSLVSAPGTQIPAVPVNLASGLYNNNASYVVLHMKVQYWYKIGDENATPVAPDLAAQQTGEYLFRTADVNYTIHLGYCNDFGNGKANDFNCRRNSQYTYDITIAGVDKVRVEAQDKEEEPQPGAEGDVTDSSGNIFALDSHYGVVNVKLTNKQRKELIWRIQAPFGDNVINLLGHADGLDVSKVLNPEAFTYANGNQAVREALPNNQFYNWVQIRPTEDENTIAHYPGDPRLFNKQDGNWSAYNGYDLKNVKPAATKDNQDGVWYLDQLADPDNFPHHKATAAEDENTEHWYTLFIDEYVYENQYAPGTNSLTGGYHDPIGHWYDYVNRDERKLWLSIEETYVSKDKESVYNIAKYMIAQESIQTYYSPSRAEKAVGIESINESYVADWNSHKHTGDGDWWSFAGGTPDYNGNDENNPDSSDNYNGGNYSANDGYYNQYWYVQTASNGGPLKWSQVFNLDYQGDYQDMTQTFRDGDRYRINTTIANQTFNIPDHENIFMDACMARNRDLNNDGEIDTNEVRWYLPTEERYTRIILGSVSLRYPLLEISNFSRDDITAGYGTSYAHYASSNKRKTWADEMAATGYLWGSSAKAGNLRCVRTIGQDPGLKPESPSEPVYNIPDAYFVHDEGNIIELNYYRLAALRGFSTGYFPTHDISDPMSRSSRMFQYAETYCVWDPVNDDEERNLDEGYIKQPRDLRVLNTKEQEDNQDAYYDNSYWTSEEPYLNKVANFFMYRNNGDKWATSVNNNSICKFYYEDKKKKSDLGTWRVPNITELGIMFILGVLNEDNGTIQNYASCTTEFFQNQNNRFMGIGGANRAIAAGNISDTRVRCVKDVQTDY